MSWQTRTLAQYIAGGYMIDGENAPLEQAGRLAMDDIEEAQLEEAQLSAAEVSAEEMVKPGSWERLQGALGRVK